MLTTLREFRALKADDSEVVIAALTLGGAAAVLEATPGTVLKQITVIRESMQVDVPTADVRFNVTVEPEVAATAGCVALPNTFLVQPGTEVIFQASAAPLTGYTFDGWYRKDENNLDVLVSEDEIASIAIVAPAAGAIADELYARFILA